MNWHIAQLYQPLEEADPRVTVVEKSGYHWNTYKDLEEAGLLEGVESVPWNSGGARIRCNSLPWFHLVVSSASKFTLYQPHTLFCQRRTTCCAVFSSNTRKGLALQVWTSADELDSRWIDVEGALCAV